MVKQGCSQSHHSLYNLRTKSLISLGLSFANFKGNKHTKIKRTASNTAFVFTLSQKRTTYTKANKPLKKSAWQLLKAASVFLPQPIHVALALLSLSVSRDRLCPVEGRHSYPVTVFPASSGAWQEPEAHKQLRRRVGSSPKRSASHISDVTRNDMRTHRLVSNTPCRTKKDEMNRCV